MQIHLSPRNVRLTSSLYSHAANMVASLEDYAEVFAAHLVLVHDEAAKPEDRYTVKAHIAVRGNDVHADVSAETIHAALDSVADKLSRQLRKRKTKLTDKRRSKVQRAKEKEKKLAA